MSYWNWDSSFSVGIEEIDNQHKQIIEYINKLYSGTIYHDTSDVKSILASLKEYTVSHFSFEERLMQEAGYSFREEHKRVHDAFIERLNFFKERHDNREDIAKELRSELQIWLTNHIQHNDTDYKEVVQLLFEKKQQDISEDAKDKWLQRLVKKFFKK